MPIAAIPEYLGSDFKSASPGLRFGMFLQLWGKNKSTGEISWSKFNNENKISALATAATLTDPYCKALKCLRIRQNSAVSMSSSDEAFLSLVASSVAPFATGLGNEHPLENGFAFLNPYGLPYLPGSGVKGTVRTAAKELASGDWGESSGWSCEKRYAFPGTFNSVEDKAQDTLLSMIDAFFGREPSAGDKRHLRGAVEFWDVIPSPPDGKLDVEIMTPHQSHYYQQKEHLGSKTPHDSGSPTPISFLTVPPNSEFTFHVRCDLSRLRRVAPDLADNGQWKKLLTAALEHAFEWLGFGAKTAVGYGAMRRDTVTEDRMRIEAEARDRQQREDQEREDRLARMEPMDRDMERLLAEARHPGLTDTTAIFNAIRDGRWSGDGKIEAAKRLKDRMRDEGTWKESSQKRRPIKDKAYQKTLRVKNWLRGE